MIGTLRVGLAVEVERNERTLPVGEAGEVDRGELREGGIETVRLNRESVGEAVAALKEKLARVGVTVAVGRGREGRIVKDGGLILSIGLTSFATDDTFGVATDPSETGLAPARRPFVL
jgi:hypothetical protein